MRRAAVAMLSALPLGPLLGGCQAACEVTAASAHPEPGLSAATAYLESLRRQAEAEDPAARAQWGRDRQEYADFRAARLPELRRHPYLLQFPRFTDDERMGWDTWFHWTAGNQLTWRDLAQRSRGRLDLLRLLDNDLLDRAQRFSRFGLLNDPGALPPERDAEGRCRKDAYGLCLDRIAESDVSPRTERWMGRPSGILGMRLFDNPDFRPGGWNPADPWNPPPGCSPGVRPSRDPAAAARASNQDCYQPPYLVGLACGFCHISFNPADPPADPARPEWSNVTGLLGNVYLQEGPLFSWLLDFGKDAFYTDYLMAQPPGTSDTSRIATDDLDNPGAINGLFEIGARLAGAVPEEMPNGRRQPVPHILKDGADSVGLPLAALRVYVNIGMLGNYWLEQHDAYLLLGGEPRPQQPFKIARAMRTAGYDGNYPWNQTELRMGDLAAFFATQTPFRLSRAPGGAGYLTTDTAQLERGKLVFADHCAGCHSSRRPEADREAQPAAFRRQMRDLVLRPDYLEGNFLSDDRRYPAPLVGVNLSRSMATNATTGAIWQDFSSLTYKRQPSLGPLTLPNPFQPRTELRFCPPAGGRGYYRTASLVGLWATAPFFHNNSVGRPIADPSVAGRMRAFADAAEQLLWPERRTDPQGQVGPYVKKTGDHVTWLELPDGLTIPLPPGYPVKVLGNLPLHTLVERLPKSLAAFLRGKPAAAGAGPSERTARRERIVREVLANPILSGELRKLLLALNAAPDFVENKGHERQVAAIGGDADKRALIEFMKTF